MLGTGDAVSTCALLDCIFTTSVESPTSQALPAITSILVLSQYPAHPQVDTEGAGQLTLPQVTQVIENLNSMAPDANLSLSEQHMKVRARRRVRRACARVVGSPYSTAIEPDAVLRLRL